MIRAEFAIETGTRTTDVVVVGPKVADGAWERVGAVRTEARVVAVDALSAVVVVTGTSNAVVAVLVRTTRILMNGDWEKGRRGERMTAACT